MLISFESLTAEISNFSNELKDYHTTFGTLRTYKCMPMPSCSERKFTLDKGIMYENYRGKKYPVGKIDDNARIRFNKR